ncbi:MAG: APC family permease [Pirellulaceae bacterium]
MATDQPEFQPQLGSFSATCIVIGAIVGIGIFFTPRTVALVTGSVNLAMLAWLVGGMIAMCGALTYAELGSRYTRNGGQYEVLRDAYAPPIGFAYVFCNATIIQAGAIAIIGYYSALYFGVLIRGEELGDFTNFLIAAIMIVGLTVANIAGVRWGSAIQNVTVIAKVSTLLTITVIALFVPIASHVPLNEEAQAAMQLIEGSSPWALVFAGLVPVFFSFGGWQHALWIGGEVKQARRNVPLAIVVGVLTVTLVYLAVNWAYFHLLGLSGVLNAEALTADAVAVAWPEIGKQLVAGAIAVSGFGVLNAQLLSGPRLVSGMARDGKFFRPFAQVHAATGTPVAAIMLLGGLGLLILLAAGSPKRIDQLLNGVVLVDAVFFLLTGIALFILRRRDADSQETAMFRVPLIFPALFVVGEIFVLAGAFLSESYRSGAYIGVLWIAGALICYARYFRGR